MRAFSLFESIRIIMLVGYGIVNPVNFCVASVADNSKVVARLQIPTEFSKSFLTKRVPVSHRPVDVNPLGSIIYSRIMNLFLSEKARGIHVEDNRRILVNDRYGSPGQFGLRQYPSSWEGEGPNINTTEFRELIVSRRNAVILYKGSHIDTVSWFDAGGEHWNNGYIGSQLPLSRFFSKDERFTSNVSRFFAPSAASLASVSPLRMRSNCHRNSPA